MHSCSFRNFKSDFVYLLFATDLTALKMNRLCSRKEPNNSDDANYYYVKGYTINYTTDSSVSSDSSISGFMKNVFNKSISSKTKKIEKRDNEPNVTLDMIRERCRIAYECRNNMICIEGNRQSQKKRNEMY